MSNAVERWQGFLDKVRARFKEVLTEADAGLDELIATEVIDPGPVAAATNEVKGRLFGLRDKIGPAWTKLEAEIGEAQRDLEDLGRELETEILKAADEFDDIVRKKQLARLEELAKEELAARVLKCTRCGAQLPEPAVLHRTENVTCTHCQAVNTVRPGPATAMAAALRPRPKK
ncbi:MAG: hypothetical protein QM817_32050 [Archangium sp.]